MNFPEDWSDADLEKIHAWLDQKFKNPNCPFCSENNWEIERSSGYLVSGSFGTGRAYPYVLIVCNNCGYTHFLNSISMKLRIGIPGREGHARS